MRDVLSDVDAWTARGDKVALAMVVGVKRSAPRPRGAKMAISSSGDVSGAVSGGCVEGAVVEGAEKVLAGGEPPPPPFGIAAEAAGGARARPALRDRRGGGVGRRAAVRRRDRRLGGALRAVSGNGGKAPSIQGEFASIARELGRGALVTVIRGENLGARMLVRVDGSTEGSLGADELDRVGVSQAGARTR